MILLALLVQAAGAGCAAPVDQSTMTRCAWEDYRRADTALNAEWPRALERLRARDRDNPMPGVPTYTATLVTAQRAWIVYRDAHCAVEGQEMRGGSAEPMLVGQCRARMTRDRIAFLRRTGQ